MKEWMPFFSVTVHDWAPWYNKYIIGPMLAILQLMILVFFLTLAARLAWIINIT